METGREPLFPRISRNWSREDEKRKLVIAKAQKEKQSQEESSGPVEDRTQTITCPPLNTDKLDTQRDEKDNLPPVAEPAKLSDRHTEDNLSDQNDSKSEKELKNIEEKSKTNADNKRRKTPPNVKSGKTSPGSTRTVKYPASIIHNSYQYQRRERERKRRRQRQIPGRMGESTGSSPVNSFFPKVTTLPKPSSYHSTYRGNPYNNGQTSLPKLGATTEQGKSSSYLPNLTQAFVKPVKTKNVQATKNIYGTYQLPSIDKRGAGY